MALTRITGTVLEDGSVTADKLSELIVDTAQIAPGAVTADKLGANAATGGGMGAAINKVQDNVTALTSNVDIVQDNVAAITDTTTDLTIQSAGSGYFFDKSLTSLGINNTVPIAGTVSMGAPANVILKYSALGGNVIIAGVDDITPYRLDVRGTANVGAFTATSITAATYSGDTTFGGDITMSDDLTITGNLTVHGDTITANSTSLLIHDPIIALSANTPAGATQTFDTTVMFNQGNKGNTVFFYDVSEKKFRVANTSDPETNTTISPITNAALIVGNLYAETFTFNDTALTATGTELNYSDGVTSAIQTQLNTGTTNTGTTYNQLNANINVVSDNVEKLQTNVTANINIVSDNVEKLQTNVTANINIVQDNVAALSGSIQLNPFSNSNTQAAGSTANTFFVGKSLPGDGLANILLISLDGIVQLKDAPGTSNNDYIVNSVTTDTSIKFTAASIPVGTKVFSSILFSTT